jgi:hypothetical protein
MAKIQEIPRTRLYGEPVVTVAYTLTWTSQLTKSGHYSFNRLMCAHFGWDQFSYRTLYGIETSQLQVRLQLVWN